MTTTRTAPPLGRDAMMVAEGLAYMNHAAAGPLPRKTHDVLVAGIERQAREGIFGVAAFEELLPAWHERASRFIGAGADEIAFLRNTGDGANVVAQGLDWRTGDEVVLCDNEFGANAYPWLALRERGVHVRFIHAPATRMIPSVLARTVTERTRVVAVSWVSFHDGYRHDLAALSEVAHSRGALFCVDAIQGLGAFPLDVKACGIDVAYAGGNKWLLALAGASMLFISREAQDRIVSRWRGWRDVEDIWDFLDYDQPPAPNATRYEGGTPSFLGVAALSASLEVLEDAGVSRIAEHVLSLTDRLVDGLRRIGAQIDSERGPGVSSGIVTFRIPGQDPVAVGRRLRGAQVVTTYRPTGVRVSPHGYNTHDEIDALLAAVPTP